ncbi:hypothetical protein ACFLQT_00655 [Bacteroidota bacterium]
MTRVKLILLLLVIPATLFANGGSVYTRYGLGDLIFLNSARNLGLGSIGFAAANGNYINSLNPAAWNNIILTRFELGMYYSGKNLSDNNSSVLYSDVEFSGFIIGFPVNRELGISVVGGLIPYSQVGYELNNVISHPLVEDDYDLNLVGSGGVNKFFIGSSYRTPFDIAIGVAFEYYTGKIDYTSLINFPITSVYRDATYLNSHKFKGTGLNLGLISNDFSDLLGIDKLKELRLGLNYNFVMSANADTTLFALTSLGTDPIENGFMDVSIPSRLGIGASFLWDDNYLVMVDYITQQMSGYKFNDTDYSFMADLERLSLSLEYKKKDVRYATFWEQVSLRGGLSYEQSQYRFNGEQISQLSLHAGVSFPIGLESSIDLGFEYGIRGTTDNNLIKENIYKVFFSINFGELWFIRQER